MARMNITWKGQDKLLRKLAKQPAEIQKEAGGIVQNTALRVEAKAKALAPVDTGNLKNNIVKTKIDALEAEVEAKTDYAIYVEKGTRKQSAQAFMQPAVDSEKPLFKKKLENLIEGGLR